jgi:predicted molibdopterin-dependent oxidoreductase YjgC
MDPVDEKDLGTVDGGRIVISSVRGKTVAKARLTDKVKPRVAFMPIHYQGSNLITSDTRDPISKIPEYKRWLPVR